MTSLPAEGPAPHSAGPLAHEEAGHGDLLGAYARMIADELTLLLPYPHYFSFDASTELD